MFSHQCTVPQPSINDCWFHTIRKTLQYFYDRFHEQGVPVKYNIIENTEWLLDK